MSNSTTLQLDLESLASVPYVEQWCGPWAILPEHLQMLAEMIRSMDVRSHLADVAAGNNSHIYADLGGGDFYSDYMQVSDGIAIAHARGPLMKHRASMSANTSTVMMRRSIRQAANDPNIRGIMLRIDSPGGTVAGTGELAAEIAAAAKRKPTHAYIEDLGASAAYWLASQGTRVSANSTALVGSIGTYAVVEDYSKLAAEKGITVHVVKAGEFKGAGIPGTEVTAEQLANIQRVIDGLNEHFLDGVASGRKLSRASVKSLNDGRVHLAEAAADLKLIDAVETFGDAFENLRSSTQSKRSVRMTTTANTDTVADDVETETSATVVAEQPAPKSLDQRAELKRYMSAFGDTSGAQYFAEGMSYPEALEAHIISLDEQLTAANSRADAAEQKLASIDLGETAIDTGAPAAGEQQAGTGWVGLFKERG